MSSPSRVAQCSRRLSSMEASQSTTKVSKHSAATAGQLTFGTGGEFLVDQRRIFGTSNRETFTDMFFHSVAFNRKVPHQVPCMKTVSKSGEVSQCQHLDRYRRARREAESGPRPTRKIQRTVERTQVRVHRDMYRSSRRSRRLLRHHKLSRENADHPEDPEDC